MSMRKMITGAVLVILILASGVVQGITYYVDPNGDDGDDGLSWGNAFLTIGKGVEEANNGDVVEVNEGLYEEGISFNGKAITVQSTNPYNWDIIENTVIDNGAGIAILFSSGEDSNSIVEGLTAHGGSIVKCYNGSSPTISRCILEEGDYGVNCTSTGSAVIKNCIIRNNAVCGVRCHGPSTIIESSLIYQNDRGIYVNGSGIQSTIENNTIIYNNEGIEKGIGSPEPNIVNCILWGNSSDDLHDSFGATYSCIEDVNDANGTGNITSDPCFLNVFDFIDVTDGGGTTTTIIVADASLYEVNDVIEYDEDGVIRTVTDVDSNSDTITFDTALDDNSVGGVYVHNWGIGASDVNEDFHLGKNSLCFDAGDPNGDYSGKRDIDGDPRVMIDNVDIGADESWFVGDDINTSDLPAGFDWYAEGWHFCDYDYWYIDPDTNCPNLYAARFYAVTDYNDYEEYKGRLCSDHVQTTLGKKLGHYHDPWDFEDPCCPLDVNDIDRYWDAHFPESKGITRIKHASNRYCCHGYAQSQCLDGIYNFWPEDESGYTPFLHDAVIVSKSEVEPNDVLRYGSSHSTIVRSVSDEKPTKIEWKWFCSGVYEYEPSSSHAFDTPMMDPNEHPEAYEGTTADMNTPIDEQFPDFIWDEDRAGNDIVTSFKVFRNKNN